MHMLPVFHDNAIRRSAARLAGEARRILAEMPSVARGIAGLLFLAAGLGVAGAQAEPEMSFQLASLRAGDCNARCPLVISAVGRITERTPQAFLGFLEEQSARNLRAVVFLDSPGGSVVASMQFGSLMRQLGAAAVVARVAVDAGGEPVVVNAQCFSACVYALIGARKRVIPRASQVGIHRMFLSAEGIDPATEEALRRAHPDNSDVRAVLSRYTSQMGVSPALIARAEHTPSRSLYILSQADIRRWHLGVPNM